MHLITLKLYNCNDISQCLHICIGPILLAKRKK